MRHKQGHWILVDELRPILPHIVTMAPHFDDHETAISTERVIQLWWVGPFPWPTLMDVRDGLYLVRSKGIDQMPQLVVRQPATIYGMEVVS